MRSGTGPNTGPTILLVGMMGSGKSVTARRVAGRLGWAWVDTDEIVQREAGLTVEEIFSRLGEEAFRDAESEAIARLTIAAGPMVVSLGGGAVLRAENRGAIRAIGTVVWLRAKPATLAARVGRGSGRPLLAAGRSTDRGDVVGLQNVLSQIALEREALYLEVADVVIDVDGLSEDKMAEQALAEVQALRRQVEDAAQGG